MISALHTAATGMQAQQLNLDTISNNLANVNTTGFKRTRINFQDLPYQDARAAGTQLTQEYQVPTGLQVGMGVRPAATEKLFIQGAMAQTDNPLDLAIEGDGLFQVTMPDGTIAYSRDGSFRQDNQGRIVNADGFYMEPSISIPQDATKVTVGVDGTVSVITTDPKNPQIVGQIILAKFVNNGGLSSIGRNLYLETVASGSAITGTPGVQGYGSIAQGFLENSNVDVVEEMVNMIVAQRAYEINSKAIKSADDMLGITANLRS